MIGYYKETHTTIFGETNIEAVVRDFGYTKLKSQDMNMSLKVGGSAGLIYGRYLGDSKVITPLSLTGKGESFSIGSIGVASLTLWTSLDDNNNVAWIGIQIGGGADMDALKIFNQFTALKHSSEVLQLLGMISDHTKKSITVSGIKKVLGSLGGNNTTIEFPKPTREYREEEFHEN